METILISLCIAISGGVIGYIFGYRHGSGDVDRIYKDVYDIKEVQTTTAAWWNGRHYRLKICCLYWRAGSSPAAATKQRVLSLIG